MKRLLIALAATTALTLPAMAQQAAQPATSSGQMQINQPQMNGASGSAQQNLASATAPISAGQLSKSQIRKIQVALNNDGFSTGHVDGVWGPDTGKAVRDFQKYKGLQATGRLDRQTLDALNVNIQVAQGGMQDQTMQIQNGHTMQIQPGQNMPVQSGQTMQGQSTAQANWVSPRDLSKSDIRKIQMALNKHGFDANHVDGVWGPDTDQAIKDFQKQQGIAGSGHLDQQTLNALDVNIQVAQANAMQGRSMAGNGSMSPNAMSKSDIRSVQIALNKKGFDTEHVDGVWGPDTSKAIRDFQKHQGMAVTGELDRQTIDALGVNVASLPQQGTYGQNGASGQAMANGNTATGTDQNLASNGTSQNLTTNGTMANGSTATGANSNLASNQTGTQGADMTANGNQTMAANGNQAGTNQTTAANGNPSIGTVQTGTQGSGQFDLNAFNKASVSLSAAASTAKSQMQSGKIYSISFDGSGSTPVFHVKAYQPGNKSVWTADVNANTGKLVGQPSTQANAQLSQQQMAAIKAVPSSGPSISNVISTAQNQGRGKAIEAQLEQTNGTPNYIVTLDANGATRQVKVDAKTGQATNG